MMGDPLEGQRAFSNNIWCCKIKMCNLPVSENGVVFILSRQAKCGHLEDKTFLVVSLILSLLKCLTLFFFVNFGILK